MAPTMLRAIREPPISGAKTMAAMIIAGRFSVDDPWAMASVASIPAPLRRKADATGTMHAEHRFIAGPTRRPFNDP